MTARKPAQGVTDDVQPDAEGPEDVQPDAAVPEDVQPDAEGPEDVQPDAEGPFTVEAAEDVTAGTRLTSPDGEVHMIVPEGVQALLALGWTESE